ncbi:hypothetical protein Dimus_009243 [Dionaea muscipula]
MPTPVITARQCLTEEAARSLDDAVGVARRRNHAQTTSLHVVSAFLSVPSSLLRDACSRARSSAYSPRLQFRALDLSVGVSLDRIPCSKTPEEAPPISNSLMAAIKRSQANQRRQPEMYHLTQIQCQTGNPMSMASIKVELKQFVLSILDDPIVSRVFGEAGFRSFDIKLAIVHPPPAPAPPSRYLRSRCPPPLFLCNLTESGYPIGQNLPFPFSGDPNGSYDYCKRIGEVLVRSSGRNPMLVGAGAKYALSCFKECVEKGKGKAADLPSEIRGLSFGCVERDVQEFLADARGREQSLDSKVKELRSMVEGSEGPGVVVNIGGLEVLVEDGVSLEAVKCLISKFASLVELVPSKKLWFIAAAAMYETYSKFVGLFPSIEKDWDLHPLPITSSKSSLMGSFVPFGGFFSGPSEFTSPFPIINTSSTRCAECNEKWERELSAVRQGGNPTSVVDRCSVSLPSWLQMADSNPNRVVEGAAAEAKDDKAALNSTVLALQQKWDDICKCHQQIPSFSGPGISVPKPENPHAMSFSLTATKQGCGRGDTSLDERVSSGLSSCMPFVAQTMSSQRHADNADSSSNLGLGSSTSLVHHDRDSSSSPTSRPHATALIYDHITCTSNSLATDLGLGTIYAHKNTELKVPENEDHGEQSKKLSNPIRFDFGKINGKTSAEITHSCSSTASDFGGQLDPREYKVLYRKLIGIVDWQQEAIQHVSQIVSSCRSRNESGASIARRDIWMSFSGPDKIGKKKIAEALAEAIFDCRESLVVADLSCQGGNGDPNSIFSYRGGPNDFDKVSRKTTVGYMAEELTKKPHSVVFLENVDEADLLVQTSLFHTIRTGKFPSPHGREISIANTVFVLCSGTTREKRDVPCENESVRFSEQRVLEARNWQLGIVVGCMDKEDALYQVSLKKRKLSPTYNLEESARKSSSSSSSSTVPKNFIDLNLPLEESEEYSTEVESSSDSGSGSGCDNSKAWLEDLLVLVHGRVAFKPFNFDALADQLLKKITVHFQKNLGSGTRLEIDDDAMVELLAAAWSSSTKGAMDDWIEQFLGMGFAEARKRYYCLSPHSVVKLVACKGVSFGEQAPGICLPTRINLSLSLFPKA